MKSTREFLTARKREGEREVMMKQRAKNRDGNAIVEGGRLSAGTGWRFCLRERGETAELTMPAVSPHAPARRLLVALTKPL